MFNFTCNDFLQDLNLHIPLSFLPMICEEAKSDLSDHSLLLQQICCQDIFPSTPSTRLDDVEKLALNTCASINITDPLRHEFCHLAEEISGHHANVETIHIICILMLSVLGPIGILSNTIIMTLVLKCRQLRNTSGYFAANLALADLFYIIGTCIYYFINIQYPNVAENLQTYYFFSSFDVMMGSASLLCVTLVTLNRVIAILRPLAYHGLMYKRKAFRFIAFVWIYCTILFILFLIRSLVDSVRYGEILFFSAVVLSFLIPSLIIIISYLKIAIVTLKNLKSERKIFKTALAIHLLSIHKESTRKALLIRPATREMKIALNLAITTVPLLVGWGYYMIKSCEEIITKTVADGITDFILNALPFIVCCLNPITYILFTRAIRHEFRKVLRSKISSSSSSSGFQTAQYKSNSITDNYV